MTTLKVGSIEHPDGGSNTVNFGGTAGIQIPSGTTNQRPSSPSTGYFRYNSTTGSTEFYNGAAWINTNLIPTIDSVSGAIYAANATNLVITATNATDIISVIFKEGATTLATVTNVSVSGGTYTVAVPSAVYGQTAGDTIAVSVTNSDGANSTNSVNKTVTDPPTGGTITTSGGYRIHTFTSSQSGASGFVVPSGTSLSNVEFLVIAGGGGGGAYGGGGGAGGYRCSVVGESSGGGASAETRLSLSAGQYDIVVGGGGAGGTDIGSYSAGSDGGNSSFSTITSTGGGGGGEYTSVGGTGRSGGSGGGGGIGEGSNISSGGSGTSGQGYAGGQGRGRPSGTYLGGGGGGGAGEAGSDSPDGTSIGGDGGDGVASSITGSSVTRAGGGGGQVSGSGGTGGGGNGGSTNSPAGDGTANTGSGGGSAAGGGSATTGDGGSGLVIIRYQP
jgi:hypothetical protein